MACIWEFWAESTGCPMSHDLSRKLIKNNYDEVEKHSGASSELCCWKEIHMDQGSNQDYQHVGMLS